MMDHPSVAKLSWSVVIIDDSPDDRAEVRRLLLRGADWRYALSEAGTGAAGVAMVLAGPLKPDCVILDFNLPDMDALEVLRQLRGADGLLVCPVVVLTGGNLREAGRMVLRLGAQDYIAKDGLTPLALTRIVENARERLTMARELLARTTALEQTERKLSDADRRKDEFIATLAHELRNPLAPIASGLQVLRLSPGGASPLTLDLMERQLLKMTHLIDDLMEVARITNGKLLLRPQRAALAGVIEDAVEAALPMVRAAGHTLQVHLPTQAVWLDVDQTRIVQAIGNLLNNAVKYSADGSAISLSAEIADDKVVIRVKDVGFGIPADMLDQVFDMFAQIDHTLGRAQGGLGIGLALVKQLVELHQGTVVAESAGVGLGSTFSIRLPVARAPPAPAPAPAPEENPRLATSRRILVVDDNVDGAMMLSEMLELSGHVLCTAFSGQQAHALAINFQPEIVFLDIGLPDMDGHAVARLFRATPLLQEALIVALTGWGANDDHRRSREAGCDVHLTKPVQLSAVATVIAQYQSTVERACPV